MALVFKRHEKISLRNHPDFCEAWLHSQICDDTTLLGLGELDVIDRERTQFAGGRLDMLLADTDPEANARYEVEIMLGPTDPNHIIRCIEYWDVERRRYPAYNHIAVLVAEEVTSRFLNVISLLSGNIPLVAIQLNALQVDEHLVLDFVKVLDQRELREDDAVERDSPKADRQWWESRKGIESLRLCDKLLEFAKAKAKRPLELRYSKSGVGIGIPGSFFHVLIIWPKKDFIPFRLGISNAEQWAARFDNVGIEAKAQRADRILIRMTSTDLSQHEDLVRELVYQCVSEFDA
jgi:hypothetical protein